MPFSASSPACGVPVIFQSSASFHGVCGFCHSTLLRHGDNLENLGRMADLAVPHPELRELATRIDIHRHAHAMIRPLPDRMWDGARTPFESGHSSIHFAHADVSGLSLFEEANYRGVMAAERTLARLGVSFASSL